MSGQPSAKLFQLFDLLEADKTISVYAAAKIIGITCQSVYRSKHYKERFPERLEKNMKSV